MLLSAPGVRRHLFTKSAPILNICFRLLSQPIDLPSSLSMMSVSCLTDLCDVRELYDSVYAYAIKYRLVEIDGRVSNLCGRSETETQQLAAAWGKAKDVIRFR